MGSQQVAHDRLYERACQRTRAENHRTWRYCVVAIILCGGNGLFDRATLGQSSDAPREVRPDRGAGELAAPASLLRDEDLERQLAEADRRMASGEWELAATLLQRALDDGRTTLVPEAVSPKRTARSQRWISATAAVEARLARFPDDALRRYRLLVDSEARGLLKDTVEQASMATLWEVARRYRYSSLGDRVVWEIARRSLERWDFVTALECCERLRERPLPTVVARESLAHVAAVAAAYLGDRATAERWLPDCRESTIIATVRRTLDDPSLAITDDDLSHGSNTRFAWEDEWRRPLKKDEQEQSVVVVEPSASYVIDFPAALDDDYPSSESFRGLLKLDDGAAWRAGYDEMLPRFDVEASGDRWWQRSAVSVHQFRSDETIWIGKFDNRIVRHSTRNFDDLKGPGEQTGEGWRIDHPFLPLEDGSGRIKLTPFASRSGNEQGKADLVRWADWMSFAYSFWGENFATLEAPTRSEATPAGIASKSVDRVPDSLPGSEPFSLAAKIPRRHWSPRARREQELTFRDMRDGSVIWRRPLSSLAKSDGDKAGPMASLDRSARSTNSAVGPPLLKQERLYLPLLRDATLSIVALELSRGEIEWETPIGGEMQDARGELPVALAADSGHVYAALGNGSCVALNAHTGAVEWGESYDRTAGGWSEDRVAITGRLLVRTSSDDEQIWIYDRRDGRRQWGVAGRLPDGSRVDRMAGVRDGRLVLCGATVLRAHDLATGKLLWQTPHSRRLGDPLLLADHALVPVGGLPDGTTSDVFLSIERPNAGAWRRAGVVSVELASGRIALVSRWKSTFVPPVSLVPGVTGLLAMSSEAFAELHNRSQPREGVTSTAGLPQLVASAQESVTPPDLVAAESTRSRWKPGESWRLLVSDLNSGRVSELNAAGEAVWESTIKGLPGAVCAIGATRRWTIDHARNELVELTALGREVKRWSGLPGRPASITEVPRSVLAGESSAAVVMTFPETGIVGGVDNEGNWLWKFTLPGRPVDARVVGENRVWVALADLREIRELNWSGDTFRTISLEDRPRWLQPATTGGVLVTYPERFQVVARTWGRPEESLARSGSRGFRNAWSLPDGEWLVVDETAYTCIASDGKTRWKREGVFVGGIAVLKP